MNLLLLRHQGYRLALDLARVARVQPFDEGMRRSPHCLLEPGASASAVVLTNRRILPAAEIESLAEMTEAPQLPNAFYRGCSRRPMIGGFVIVAGRIYGMLSDQFLNHEE